MRNLSGARSCFLLLILAAAGCVAPAAQTASGSTAARSAGGPSPTLLDFVGRAAIGESTALSDGTVKVTVVSAYYAASGHNCRRYTVVNDKGASQQRIACQTGQGWSEVRPLVVSEGLSPAQ